MSGLSHYLKICFASSIMSVMFKVYYIVRGCLITCVVRSFSLPFLLFGDVRKGRLQQGQVYPS